MVLLGERTSQGPRGQVVTETHRSTLLDENKLLMTISAYWTEKTRAILEAVPLEGKLKCILKPQRIWQIGTVGAKTER